MEFQGDIHQVALLEELDVNTLTIVSLNYCRCRSGSAPALIDALYNARPPVLVTVRWRRIKGRRAEACRGGSVS
jgi:hypothetical protein